MTLPTDFVSGLLTIVLLDLVLAGDNAIVIALAAHDLPRNLQTRAIFWGTLGAIGVRIVLTGVVVYLLKLPGLMLIGGLLLLPIAWKLVASNSLSPAAISTSTTQSFWVALRTIILADALMGLDNVLAIAGAAEGHILLVVLGLLISVPLVVWGSTLVLRLIERFPLIIYVGAAAIAWTAGRMMIEDPIWHGWFAARPWRHYAIEAALVFTICVIGWLRNRTHRHAS